jgi:hypothetical protein
MKFEGARAKGWIACAKIKVQGKKGKEGCASVQKVRVEKGEEVSARG